MSHKNQTVPEGKDPALWALAQQRADFKDHLIVYILVNGLMWIMWCCDAWGGGSEGHSDFSIQFPIWSSVGWGIAVAFHFAEAYLFSNADAVEKEYQKLNHQPIN